MTTAVHREPVLGIHDRISPEGRFTIELYDEHTGKVVHSVKQDNTILNSYKRLTDQRVRHSYDIWSQNNGGGAYNFGTYQDNWWQQLGNTSPLEGPMQYGMESQYRGLYLSDTSQAVNADEWAIPGNLVAQVNGAVTHPYNQSKTGTPTPIQMVADRSRRRWCFDFLPTQAIGTISSFGFGSLLPSTWYATDDVTGLPSYIWNSPGTHNNYTQLSGSSNTNISDPYGSFDNISLTSNAVNVSAAWSSPGVLWFVAGGTHGIRKYDLNTNSARPSGHTAAVTGPSPATIGAASTDNIGLAIIGTDMWLSYALTLKKCAFPADTTLTVSNTYATVSGFTDAAIFDITTDGTSLYLLGSTKVFIVNPATGAVTSSWAHGLNTGTTPLMCSIEYTAAPVPYLYITANKLIAGAGQSNEAYYTSAAGTRNLRTYSFTTAGVAGPYHWGHQNTCIYGALGATGNVVWTGSFANGWGGCSYIRNASLSQLMFRGPQHMSRAVLGSPVVKDSSKAMRVIYDFEFS